MEEGHEGKLTAAIAEAGVRVAQIIARLDALRAEQSRLERLLAANVGAIEALNQAAGGGATASDPAADPVRGGNPGPDAPDEDNPG